MLGSEYDPLMMKFGIGKIAYSNLYLHDYKHIGARVRMFL